MIQPPGRGLTIVMQILGAIGGIFATIGVGWWANHQAGPAVSVQGTVVELVHGGGSGRKTKPVVRFSAEGRTVQITGSVATSPPAYSIGETVEVRYPPGKPEDGWINSFTETLLLPVIFGGVGGVMLTVVAVMAAVRSKARARFARIMGGGMAVDAELVDIQIYGNSSVNGRRRWALTAEHRPESGAPMRFTDTIWSAGPPPFGLGKKVRVHYLRENPGECLIDPEPGPFAKA